MKIGIIGAGSIGLLIGASYADNHEVTMVTRRKEQAEVLCKEGIQITISGEKSVKSVSAQHKPEILSEMDFIYVALKQYQLDDIAPVLQGLPRHIPLCFIQNGMGHLRLVDSLPQLTIFVATIEHGAVKQGDRNVIQNGVGTMNIAIMKASRFWRKVNTFPKSELMSFPVTFHEEHEFMLLDKLVANAVINPLTAILDIPNGRLIDNPDYYQLFVRLYEEIASVLPLGKRDYFSHVKGICLNTKDNSSSMRKDINEGRQTEVDAILGYILEQGKQKGVDTPIMETIYTMVKGMERGK